MFHKQIAISFVALLPTALLFAQVDPAPRPQTGAAQTDPKKDRGNVANDAILVSWLLTCNSNEIALARVAQQKAQSNEVKQFAQKMIDDHGQLAQKLQPFAGANTTTDQGSKPNDRGSVTSDRGTGSTERGTGAENRGTGGEIRGTGRDASASGVTVATQSTTMGAFDHSALIRDLGKKCLESETKMLNEKTGADFDRCYMSMVVGAHVKAADMMEVFGTYASERLRPTLEAGHKTIVAHLEHAKTLCKQTETGGKHNDKGEKIGSPGGR